MMQFGARDFWVGSVRESGPTTVYTALRFYSPISIVKSFYSPISTEF